LAVLNHIVRFVVAAIVLLVVGYLVPGFDIHGFATAVLSAAVISALGWIIESFIGGVTPYGRGLIGFITTALIIYATKYIISGVHVTLIGALLGALLIGIIDLFLPSSMRFRM
jgi:putative membrane protein